MGKSLEVTDIFPDYTNLLYCLQLLSTKRQLSLRFFIKAPDNKQVVLLGIHCAASCLIIIVFVLFLPSCRQGLLESQANDATVANFALHITDTDIYVRAKDTSHATEVKNMSIVPPHDEDSLNKSGTSFTSKEPLKIGEIKFKFQTKTKQYDCTLQNKNLRRRIFFEASTCDGVDLHTGAKNEDNEIEQNENNKAEQNEEDKGTKSSSALQQYFSRRCLRIMQRNEDASFTLMTEDTVVNGKRHQAKHSYRHQLHDRKPTDPNYHNVVFAGLAHPDVIACMQRADVRCSYDVGIARQVLLFARDNTLIARVESDTSLAGFYVENDKLMANTVNKDNSTHTDEIFPCP